ncbi:MAG: Smr/MutS family protein [Cucumibacter sp.]
MPKIKRARRPELQQRTAMEGHEARPLVKPRSDDTDLWAEVTRSVKPLKARRTNHPNPAPRPRAEPLAVARPRDPLPARAAASAGKPIEPGLRRKLVRGREAIDATLDLHGMRQADALEALTRFIRAAAGRGDRNVLVITGKGLRSEGTSRLEEPGVLRRAVPRWLAGSNLAPHIAGVAAAARLHGGEGALYVRLKRRLP